jgi:hypothetical protein
MRSGRPLFAMNRMRAVREWTSLARSGGSVEVSAEIRKVVDSEVSDVNTS